MLLTNILLGIIIFVLIKIFSVLTDIDKKLSNKEAEKMKKFYSTLMDSIKKKKETVSK